MKAKTKIVILIFTIVQPNLSGRLTSIFVDLVLNKEQRKERQYKRKKNSEGKRVALASTKIEPNANVTIEELEIQRRLNSPVLPDEIKEIDIRRKCFMDFVADRNIKYFSSRTQASNNQ